MSGKKTCCVWGCLNTYKHNPSMSFFTLPTDITRRNNWLQLISRQDLMNKNHKSYAVCEIHFDEKFIVQHFKCKILSRKAIPSSHLPLPQEQQQLPQQMQQHKEIQVTANDYTCDACHKVFVNSDHVKQEPQEEGSSDISHRHVCLKCGVSLARARKHTLGDENNKHILDVVRNWIQPQEVEATDILCHRCFQKADTEAVNATLSVSDAGPEPQRTDTIILPNYSRASDTHGRCIFLQCNSISNRIVSLDLRMRLLVNHNYYVPPNCRICELHSTTLPWKELLDADNVNRSFTASQIEDIIELLKE